MNLRELVRFVGDLFSRHRARYFTFGAISMGFWIKGRATQDLDLVVSFNRRTLMRLTEEMQKNGIEMTRSLQRKLLEGRIIKIPVQGGFTRLDMKPCNSPFDWSALKRSKVYKDEDITLSIATPEDIILYKLISFRPQDVADIIRIRKEYRQLDYRHIETWIRKLQKETGKPILKRWKEAG